MGFRVRILKIKVYHSTEHFKLEYSFSLESLCKEIPSLTCQFFIKNKKNVEEKNARKRVEGNYV